jgi:chromosome segregation ATPase
LKETRSELEKVLCSYEELKEYKMKLEKSLSSAKNEHNSLHAELSKEREGSRENVKRTELLANQNNNLLTEIETLKGTCKSLKREKEVLMATYCRVMKENDKLRSSSEAENSIVGDAESKEEMEHLRRKCKEWEV